MLSFCSLGWSSGREGCAQWRLMTHHFHTLRILILVVQALFFDDHTPEQDLYKNPYKIISCWQWHRKVQASLRFCYASVESVAESSCYVLAASHPALALSTAYEKRWTKQTIASLASARARESGRHTALGISAPLFEARLPPFIYIFHAQNLQTFFFSAEVPLPEALPFVCQGEIVGPIACLLLAMLVASSLRNFLLVLFVAKSYILNGR